MPVFSAKTELSFDDGCKFSDAITELDETAMCAACFKSGDGWVIDIHFDVVPNLDRLNAHAQLILEHIPDFVITEIDTSIDWVAQTLLTLKPVIAGDFFVYGKHDKDKLTRDKIGIEIEAAQAFGTGRHETTFGCLEAIDALQAPHQNILDLGCGSAILAIAYAKKFGPTPPPILATDIDACCIEHARINLKTNHVAKHIKLLTANGMAHKIIQSRAPFDLVFANILANPLIKLSADIAKATTHHATLVLSGLLQQQARMVMDAYTPLGFSIFQRFDHGEWACLMLQRG